MVTWILVVLCGGVVFRLAQIEGRHGLPWGLAAALGAWFLARRMGLSWVGPAIALVLGYLGLWIANLVKESAERERS